MRALDSITVKGFRSIASIECLRLCPINVLIGANGSGKSNFLEIFSFLHAIRAGHLRNYVSRAGGADRVLHFGSKVTQELTIHVSFEDSRHEYGITLAASDTDELYPLSLYPLSEDLFFRKREKYSKPVRRGLSRSGGEAGISDPERNRRNMIGRYVREHLDRWRLHHFQDTSATSPIRKTTDLNDNHHLRPDGSNLAAFLYYLQRKHEASYDMIRRTVRLVAPFFDDFHLRPQALNEDKIRIEWLHKGSEAYFDAASLSDGSLRFIALATLLLQPVSHRPSVILLDEPELGLHPRAITALASLVKQASVETQIILSTQSPLLLDHFRPDDVLVAERMNGATELTRLDGADLDRWLQDYSLGQLWEKNELGGRPVPEGVDGGPPTLIQER